MTFSHSIYVSHYIVFHQVVLEVGFPSNVLAKGNIPWTLSRVCLSSSFVTPKKTDDGGEKFIETERD